MIRMVFSYRHLHHRDEVLYIEQAFSYSMWNLKPYLPMVQTNKICVDIFICIAERTTTTTTLKIMLDRSISALDVLMVSFVSDGRNLPTNVTTHIWCLLCNLTTKSSLKYSSFPNCFFSSSFGQKVNIDLPPHQLLSCLVESDLIEPNSLSISCCIDNALFCY